MARGACVMAKRTLPDMSPWRRLARHPLTIPPDSMQAWIRLVLWECWIGILVCCALVFGTRLIVTAPDHIVTVFDFSKCYAAPPLVQPCERVAYRAGTLNVALNAWFGLLLVGFAVLLLWELWSAAAPKPITDEFLKLLDDSFGRNWRRPSTWPWTRMGWAYGFTLAGALSAFGLGLIASTAMSSSASARAPAVRVETSERFRGISHEP
jgi:hypothetical protein